MDQSYIPIVYAVINAAYTVIGIPGGILADKIGKEKVVLLSYIIFPISSILMIVSINNVGSAYILATLFGLYVGFLKQFKEQLVQDVYQLNKEERLMVFIV